MKTCTLINFVSAICLLFTISGCSYNNLQPRVFEIDNAGNNFEISTASKCHVIDGSVIVYTNGFKVDRNVIRGVGDRYFFTGNEEVTEVLNFPLDSIVAITIYDDYTDARIIANGSLYIWSAAVTGTTIYCISCPKCCFGSCPTIYTFSNGIPSLETELFSSSISKMLEDDDLDKLKEKIPDNGIYKIKITNEALETHYIDKFNLTVAEHPLGTMVYLNIDKGLTVIQNTGPALSAVNSDQDNIMKEINSEDTLSYRSGMKMVNELKNGPKYDWINITSPVPENAGKAKVLVRYKNTLLSTILFYDVVLGSQGIRAVQWTDKMNNDPLYAADFKMIYDNFSGMEFEIFENGKWISAGKFPDAGPICWKDVAAEVSVSGLKELKFRLKFIPDNFMIDYIGIEYESIEENNLRTESIVPNEVINNSNDSASNTISLLETSDKNYLITNPGDSYDLIYKIPKKNDVEQTVFISSRGFYNEWIRGSWIKNDTATRRFDLYSINRNLRLLAQSWEESKSLIEGEFFNTRIAVKENEK